MSRNRDREPNNPPVRVVLIQPNSPGNFNTPPMGLQILATVLEQSGFSDIVDLDPNKGDDLYKDHYQGQAVIAGLTVTFMTLSESFSLARHIKKLNPKALVIFGGPQPTLDPDESLANPAVDGVVIGEGEQTLVEIVRHVQANLSLRDIAGLWYRENGKTLVKNPPRPFLANLNLVPYPSRKYFTDSLYRRRLVEKLFLTPFWYIMTSRSCPYNCHSCQPALKRIAGPWRQRSVDHVVQEMRTLYEQRKARSFRFLDNDLGIDRQWLVGFCEKVRELKSISMDGLGRANLLDFHLLKLMREAGFYTISVGAESGSDRVLQEIMNKNITVRQIVAFAENCYQLGIMASAFWMIANPGETLDEMKETIKLASELPIFYCHFHVANPNPGTRYYLDAVSGGYLRMDSWDDIHDRSKPTLLKNGITREDIQEIDRLLIATMVKKGWRYSQNGHTLSFYNTLLYAKIRPTRALGNEILAYFSDRQLYHLHNIRRGLGSIFSGKKKGSGT